MDTDLSRMGDLIDDNLIDSFLGHGTPQQDLQTILDVFRFALTEFSRPEALLSFGQPAIDAMEEAHLLMILQLRLPLSSTAEFLERWGSSRLTSLEVETLTELIAKRAEKKIPVAYLCKGCFQQGEQFYVDERALIPRSFIAELLNHQSKHFLYRTKRGKQARAAASPSVSPTVELSNIRSVLDMCCGSGALAILAYRMLQHNSGGLWDGIIHAVDISPPALEVASINIKSKGLGSRVSLFEGDLYQALPEPTALKYDLIITNPPYVSDVGMAALPAEFKREPALALAGGRAGLDLARRIIAGAADHLSPGGQLVVELGLAGQELRDVVRKHRMGSVGISWPSTSNSKGEVAVLTRDAAVALKDALS